jgi:hypothetical protein
MENRKRRSCPKMTKQSSPVAGLSRCSILFQVVHLVDAKTIQRGQIKLHYQAMCLTPRAWHGACVACVGRFARRLAGRPRWVHGWGRTRRGLDNLACLTWWALGTRRSALAMQTLVCGRFRMCSLVRNWWNRDGALVAWRFDRAESCCDGLVLLGQDLQSGRDLQQVHGTFLLDPMRFCLQQAQVAVHCNKHCE